jgi:hypothetical protein
MAEQFMQEHTGAIVFNSLSRRTLRPHAEL